MPPMQFKHAHKHFVAAPGNTKVQDIWERIDHPGVLANVQTLKAYKDLASAQARWCCSSCPDFDANTSDIIAHLAQYVTSYTPFHSSVRLGADLSCSGRHDIQDIKQAFCNGSIYSHPSNALNEGYCIEIPLFMRTYGSGSDTESDSDDGDWP